MSFPKLKAFWSSHGGQNEVIWFILYTTNNKNLLISWSNRSLIGDGVGEKIHKENFELRIPPKPSTTEVMRGYMQ